MRQHDIQIGTKTSASKPGKLGRRQTRKTFRFPDFDATAKNLAEHSFAKWFQDHRGVAEWCETGWPLAVAFGNDGYSQDIRSRAEVGVLRKYLAEANIKQRAFAVGGEGGYSWVMIVGTSDVEPVGKMLSRAATLSWFCRDAERQPLTVDELVEDLWARRPTGGTRTQ